MSQPHPPRPEGQPAQQPSHPEGPRTQEIPVVQPEAPASPAQPAPAAEAAPPVPGPAFSTEAGWHPGGAHAAPGAPPGPVTAGPPPPVPPGQMSPPSFRPQPVPTEQVWPQPAASPEFPPPESPPAADAAWSAQSPGSTDFVPGFGPSAPSPTPPPTPSPAAGSTALPATGQLPAAGPGAAPDGSGGRRASRLGAKLRSDLPGAAAGHRDALVGLAVGVLGLVLLEVGLARDFGNESLWSVVPTWSAFATVAALVALLPLVARWVPGAPAAGTTWRIGLAAVVGLGAFWVLVALPLVASDRGFLLTAGPALAAAAVWLAPGRGGSGGDPNRTP